MNELLSQPINTAKTKKLCTFSMLLLCMLPVLINCIVLVPIYTALNANALYSSSVLPVIIKYIQDFFDLTAFSVSYSLIIFSVLLISKKQARKVALLYTLVFFAKIPIKLVMNIFIYGSLGSATDITIDLIYMGVYFALEMLQLLVVWLFAATDADKYMKRIAFSNKKKKAKSVQGFKVLPLTSFFNLKNPLQRSAFKMSIFICGIKILTRVANDIVINAPTSFAEVMIMVIYYLSDLLYGVVAYIIALLVFNTVYELSKETQTLDKKSTDEEHTSSVLD